MILRRRVCVIGGRHVPDGLVRHDDLGPVLNAVSHGLQLGRHDADGLALLALLCTGSVSSNLVTTALHSTYLKRLAAAQNDAETAIKR